jgi:hypothetical protein
LQKAKSIKMEGHVTDILENRDHWQVAFRTGWLAHYQQTGEIDWSRYARADNKMPVAGPSVDLGQSRLLFISSAGGYLSASQTPFDADHALGDYSIRSFPSSAPLDALAYAHEHYDHAAVDCDPQVLIPLRHLADLVDEGTIGELSPSAVSFMGYQPNLGRIIDETIPAILQTAQAEGAHAALLVPA